MRAQTSWRKRFNSKTLCSTVASASHLSAEKRFSADSLPCNLLAPRNGANHSPERERVALREACNIVTLPSIQKFKGFSSSRISLGRGRIEIITHVVSRLSDRKFRFVKLEEFGHLMTTILARRLCDKSHLIFKA